MTATLVLIAVWVTSGLLSTYLMMRAGYRHAGWLLICLLLGPFGLPIMWERAERKSRVLTSHESGETGDQGLRLLIGLDGSAESEQAFEAALGILGPSAGTVLLVAVVDYDSAEDVSGGRTAAAEARLATNAARVPRGTPSYSVLAGRPGPALLQFADEHGVDVIAVGRRGRGMSTRLLGSVSTELLRGAAVPVIVGGRISAPPTQQPGQDAESAPDRSTV